MKHYEAIRTFGVGCFALLVFTFASVGQTAPNINNVLSQWIHPVPGSDVQIAPMTKAGDPTPGRWTTIPNDLFGGILARSGVTPGVSSPPTMVNEDGTPKPGHDGFLQMIDTSEVLNADKRFSGSRSTFGWFVKVTQDTEDAGPQPFEFFILMSYDLVHDKKDEKDRAAFEVFVFGPIPRVGSPAESWLHSGGIDTSMGAPLLAGLVVNGDGQSLTEVPPEIAMVNNYHGDAPKDETVKPGVAQQGSGCLRCHARETKHSPEATTPFPWVYDFANPPKEEEKKEVKEEPKQSLTTPSETTPRTTGQPESPKSEAPPQEGALKNTSFEGSGDVAMPVAGFAFDSTVWCTFHPTFPFTVPLTPPNAGTARTDLTAPQTASTPPYSEQGSKDRGPVIGFAYSPQWGGFLTGNGKTTFRGGYRSTYDPAYYNYFSNALTTGGLSITPTPSANESQRSTQDRGNSDNNKTNGPPPVYFNAKASQTAIQQGQNAQEIGGTALKFYPMPTLNPTLPGPIATMKDTDTGHADNPVQGIIPANGSLTLPIPQSSLALGSYTLRPSFRYDLKLDYGMPKTSYISDGGGPIPGGKPAQSVQIGNTLYTPSWVPTTAQPMTYSSDTPFEINPCWTHLPYAPSNTLRIRIDPRRALPGASLELSKAGGTH